MPEGLPSGLPDALSADGLSLPQVPELQMPTAADLGLPADPLQALESELAAIQPPVMPELSIPKIEMPENLLQNLKLPEGMTLPEGFTLPEGTVVPQFADPAAAQQWLEALQAAAPPPPA